MAMLVSDGNLTITSAHTTLLLEITTKTSEVAPLQFLKKVLHVLAITSSWDCAKNELMDISLLMEAALPIPPALTVNTSISENALILILFAVISINSPVPA
jgi:hypothetical protein